MTPLNHSLMLTLKQTELFRSSHRYGGRTLSTIQRRTQQQTTNAAPRTSSEASYASPDTAAPTTGATTQTSAAAQQDLSDAPPLPDVRTPTAAELQAAMRASPATSRTGALAQSLRKHAKGTTETYIAYGATEVMFKSCSAQADYTMPQAKEKGVELPKGPDGMEMGVPAKGSFWYEGMNAPSLSANSTPHF